ncbi:hypothetical protein P691DRAFT_768199 [Macrolepiota fuliginosa MF-IS2]|uniref:Uncharacterized protein n=1 Tax=Macrolepiota fuliginosa MF-IS2 TaxID=1400762 RepID=A0A9P6BW32_9AGAR|nr:hypothetical protein P691DRAFT_768199 [Macrolepiota fuliginosa MF-IS2]
MEPPTPACVFSEAAMQTPAPIPVVATPPPPPLPVPSTILSLLQLHHPSLDPHLGPHLPRLQQKPFVPPPPPLCKAHHGHHRPHPRPPKVPSQFFIETSVASDISLPGLMDQANIALSHTKSPLHINSACLTSSSITCATTSVPSQSDLNISFIKIINIPYFKPSTTEPPNEQEIGDQLIPSPILVNMIEHAWFVCNLPKADSSTFWINLVDSQ